MGRLFPYWDEMHRQKSEDMLRMVNAFSLGRGYTKETKFQWQKQYGDLSRAAEDRGFGEVDRRRQYISTLTPEVIAADPDYSRDIQITYE